MPTDNRPLKSPCETCPRLRPRCEQGGWRKCPVYQDWFRRVWAALTGRRETCKTQSPQPGEAGGMKE